MNSFLIALQLLTAIPIKVRKFESRMLPAAVSYFPFVGLFIASILLIADTLFLVLNLNNLAISALLVILLTAITGGMHLDGLADTLDGLYAGKSREESLKIMRQPQLGAMGIIGITSSMLLKVSLMNSVTAYRSSAIFLMCVVSRWAMVLVMHRFGYARKDGKAAAFIEAAKEQKHFAIALIISVSYVLVAFWWKGLAIFFLATLSAYLFARYSSNKIGGITGDTLGAVNETAEISTLLAFCIFNGLMK